MANKQMSTLTIGENTYEMVDATARANKIDKTNLVQTTGTATDKVMSQNAVTQAINAASSGTSVITINVETATSGTFTDEQMAQLADENSIIKLELTLHGETYSKYLTLHQVVNNLDNDSLIGDYEYAAVVGSTVHRVIVTPADPSAAEPTPNTWRYLVQTIGGEGIVAKYTTSGGTAEFPVSVSKFYFFEIYNISTDQYGRKAFVNWFTFENGQIKNPMVGNVCNAYYDSTTGKVIVGMGELDSGQYLVIQYPAGQGDITCIVENTPILIKDRTTNELTTKLVQDIKVGDELAFWSPIAGGLSYNKVIMPVVVGDCTAYNKVCFSDGSYVNVYGNQLFWDVDKDAMISYKEMTTENRVCKRDGTIVHFSHIEEMVSDAVLKHYTIMTQYGKFIANGVQTGDKVELFYPRFQRDENLSYWMKLTDKQRQFYIDKYNDGLTRRNWFTSELYRETLYPLFKEKREQNKLLEEKQAYLDSTDYQVVKKMEGLLTDDEFAPVKVARQEARDAINTARDRIAELDTIIKEKEAEVKATIYGKRKYTYHNAFEGKTRAVLDDEEPSAD